MFSLNESSSEDEYPNDVEMGSVNSARKLDASPSKCQELGAAEGQDCRQSLEKISENDDEEEDDIFADKKIGLLQQQINFNAQAKANQTQQNQKIIGQDHQEEEAIAKV